MGHFAENFHRYLLGVPGVIMIGLGLASLIAYNGAFDLTQTGIEKLGDGGGFDTLGKSELEADKIMLGISDDASLSHANEKRLVYNAGLGLTVGAILVGLAGFLPPNKRAK